MILNSYPSSFIPNSDDPTYDYTYDIDEHKFFEKCMVGQKTHVVVTKRVLMSTIGLDTVHLTVTAVQLTVGYGYS